jgi:hypothetical protein|tara:strand:- start:413 stop:550 length:138 start_codon:yes stop_codon:yes gene_type:complete
MTEKERTNFFFFARVCISDDALFEAKVAIEAKKEQSFGQFQRKIE